MSGQIGEFIIGVNEIGLFADPAYDVLAAINALAPGLVVQRESYEAIYDAWAANGYQPLTQALIVAAIGPLPALVTSIPRLPGVIP